MIFLEWVINNGSLYLYGLFLLIIITLILSIERFLYYRQIIPQIIEDLKEKSKTITSKNHHITKKNQYINQLLPKLEKYTQFLATLSTISPYLGLLGTLVGIMKAFSELQNSEQLINSGIAEALLATATGLLIAIISTLSYNYCQHQITNILRIIEIEMIKPS